MKVLVTGAAGFIGSFVVQALLRRGDTVVGVDNINDYYDVDLKYGRLAISGIKRNDITNGQLIQSSLHPNCGFLKINIQDAKGIDRLFEVEGFDRVVHLAAQAGVRYSLENPQAYIDTNITGFLNILEASRSHGVAHLVYASSSSVYGSNTKMPFSTSDSVDHPISLYAASKKANELMAHSYSHLYELPTTGLRFFTVYGPWGRPDMALFLFTKAIFEDRPIQVFNEGRMARDFTYVDDIVNGVVRVLDDPPTEGNDHTQTNTPYKIYNIGNNDPVELIRFIEEIEKSVGKKAIKNLMPMQPGDVPKSWADVTQLIHDLDYQPNTPIEVGVANFVNWYREFYDV